MPSTQEVFHHIPLFLKKTGGIPSGPGDLVGFMLNIAAFISSWEKGYIRYSDCEAAAQGHNPILNLLCRTIALLIIRKQIREVRDKRFLSSHYHVMMVMKSHPQTNTPLRRKEMLWEEVALP